jgi:Flp pilus assembly protein TadD
MLNNASYWLRFYLKENMVTKKSAKSFGSTKDFLKVITSNAAVASKNGKTETVTPESIAKFIRGEMTWAQVQGISMKQTYDLAEMGYQLFLQGRNSEAQKIFEGLIVLNPYDGYFHSVLGSIFARSGQADKAVQEYSIAINLDPKDPQVLVNRAELNLQKGQFEDALNDLKAAIALDPNGKHSAVIRAKALASATVSMIAEILKSKQATVSEQNQTKK